MSSFIRAISPEKIRSDLYSLSDDLEPSAVPLVISVLASLIERTIAKNDEFNARCCSNSSPQKMLGGEFYSVRVLDMSMQLFMERIFRYTKVSPPVYVVAYVYTDRLCQINPGIRLLSGNVHRLLVTAIMVASKFVEDLNYRNSYFAEVGGLSKAELNRLEVKFLFLMKFKLHVSASVFESYCDHLEREVSFGGGYHIERTLKFMFAGDIFSRERKRRDHKSKNQLLDESLSMEFIKYFMHDSCKNRGNFC